MVAGGRGRGRFSPIGHYGSGPNSRFARAQRKAFFSEEKNQKTFSDAVADAAGGTYT